MCVCVSVAMQQICGRIYRDQHVQNVEPAIAAVGEVFRLQQQHLLDAAEQRYLPTTTTTTTTTQQQPEQQQQPHYHCGGGGVGTQQ